MGIAGCGSWCEATSAPRAKPAAGLRAGRTRARQARKRACSFRSRAPLPPPPGVSPQTPSLCPMTGVRLFLAGLLVAAGGRAQPVYPPAGLTGSAPSTHDTERAGETGRGCSAS